MLWHGNFLITPKAAHRAYPSRCALLANYWIKHTETAGKPFPLPQRLACESLGVKRGKPALSAFRSPLCLLIIQRFPYAKALGEGKLALFINLIYNYYMKKALFFSIFLLSAMAVFSQAAPRQSIVAILHFEPRGSDISAREAESLSEQLANEIRSWGALTIVNDPQGAEFLVRGYLERVDGQLILSATTYDRPTNRALNTAREQAATVAALSSQMFSFAVQVTENIPFPNYLLGKWQARIDLDDGPLTCILEFRSDRTLIVEQFDTWEHRGEASLRYQGFGTGTYSYWGHARRAINEKPVDGFVSISFRLQDTLTRYSVASYNRVNLSYNESKTVFELVDGGFGCGNNYAGPSVFPGDVVAYGRFTKIN